MEGFLLSLRGFTSVSSRFGLIWLSKWPIAASGDERWPGSGSACFTRHFSWEDMKRSEQADTLLPHKGYSVSLVHLANSCAFWDKHRTRSADHDMDPLRTRRCIFLFFTIKGHNNNKKLKKMISIQRDSCNGRWIIQVSALNSSILPNSDRQHFPTSKEWSDSNFDRSTCCRLLTVLKNRKMSKNVAVAVFFICTVGRFHSTK